MKLVELLAPAKDYAAAAAAVDYGADAVYIGGARFGARQAAGNSAEEIARVVEYAHRFGVRVHATLNTLVWDDELEAAERQARSLIDAGVDALIVQDMALRRMDLPVELHASTQVSNRTPEGARFLGEAGFARVILERNLTLEEIRAICAATAAEVECFVHGAVCVGYSGRCFLSRSMSARSGNRGACSQPCRWTYTLYERTRPEEAMPIEEDERGTAILSSRDICMMEHLPRLMESGVCCFKIEGRMKTEIYIATVVGAYRRAMDAYAKSPAGYRADAALQRRLRGELDKISHRVYDTGFYFGQPKVCGEAVGVTQEAEYMGYVLDASGGEALVEMKNRFFVGDELETVTPKGSEKLVIEDIVIERTGEHVGVVNVPMERVRIPCGGKLQAGDMLRGPVRNRA